jgi:hypothetical protein
VIASPNQLDIDLPEDFMSMDKVKKPVPEKTWNRLSAILLVVTIVTGFIMISIYVNPQTSLNPFPPVVIPARVVIPSATATQTSTEMPAETLTPFPTDTPFPTETPEPSETLIPITPVPVIATDTSLTSLPGTIYPSIKATDSVYSFIVQPGSPAAVSSSIMRPEGGCKWMGVGGQVVDMQGAPIIGLRVQLYGSLHGKIKAITSLTGTVDRYGPAGYEITISDFPTSTTHTLWLQLFNQAGGALSDKVYFDTYTGCEKNLIVIHFKEVK